MIILTVLVVILLGWCIAGLFNVGSLLRLGLSFLIGVGMVTIIMFLCDVAGVKSGLPVILVVSIVDIIWIVAIFKVKLIPHGVKFHKHELSWWLLLVIVVTIACACVVKSLYYPTFAYDNVTGYDLMAKVVSAEGSFVNSLFTDGVPIMGSAKRLTYPPLVSGSLSLAYSSGLQTSKIITSLFFIFFVISFYAVIRMFSGAITSMFGLLMVVLTSEFLAFSSLSTTNIPFAIYVSLGIMLFYSWVKSGNHASLCLSVVLLGLGAWTRSEGIIFILPVTVMLMIKNRKLWLPCVVMWLPFIAWSIFVKSNYSIDQMIFSGSLFDIDKLKSIFLWAFRLMFNVRLYGITFITFLMTTVFGFKREYKLLLIIVVAWLMFTLMYYKIDTDMLGSVDKIMSKSYKRGLLVFVPLSWFYICAVLQKILDTKSR